MPKVYKKDSLDQRPTVLVVQAVELLDNAGPYRQLAFEATVQKCLHMVQVLEPERVIVVGRKAAEFAAYVSEGADVYDTDNFYWGAAHSLGKMDRAILAKCHVLCVAKSFDAVEKDTYQHHAGDLNLPKVTTNLIEYGRLP